MGNYADTIPSRVPDDVADLIVGALQNAEGVTVEDREYKLDAEDFDAETTVQTDESDFPYAVRGETSAVDEVAVSVDDGGTPLDMGDDFVRISIQLSVRPSHFKERGKDIAGRVYDALSNSGVSRPEGNPKAGVQFGRGVVAVETVVPLDGGDE